MKWKIIFPSQRRKVFSKKQNKGDKSDFFTLFRFEFIQFNL